MVKSKRDVNTPRRRASLTRNRTISRAISRPTSAVPAVALQPVAPNIRVVVRVRPPNENEQGENSRQVLEYDIPKHVKLKYSNDSRTVVKVVDDQMLIFDPKEEAQAFFFHGVQQRGRDLLKKSHKDMQFMFDKVFSVECGNDEVFLHSTHSLITSLMEGYNCSVFAYGATGAGKTFTMTGKPETPGITFLTMTELFNKREELSIEREFELGITYLEVYNELVKDLLNPGPPLQLREDGKYGVMVAGIKVYKIEKSDELFTLLEQGNRNRTQHPTDANAESSRSHAVFQVYIQMTMKGTGEVRTAKLSMIDLAGSERGSATGYVGARFTEGANINKSLLALGNCINSLADGQRHVPYRDSKLTRLLKDSLGGNCQTVMIANYAIRAKKIKSHVKRNLVNVELHVGHYVKMVEELQKENSHLKAQLNEEKNKNDNGELRQEYEKLQREYDKLKAQLSSGGQLVSEEIKQKVEELFKEKREMVERQFQLLKSEMGTNLRRRIKEEIDARLSGVCTNTPEKREAHRKIGNMVDRFKKQEDAIKTDIALIETSRLELDKKINDMVNEHPELEAFVNLQRKSLENFALSQQVEIEQRQSELLLEDHTTKCAQLEKMAVFVKKCYLILQGHDFMTPDLTKQYQEMALDFQGRKNVKWAETCDSGVGSSSTLFDDENSKSNRNKRKIEEASTGGTLDSTFTMSINLTPNKPKVKICAEQLMSKAVKPPPAKRLVGGLSPKSPKTRDNKAVRRAFQAIESSRMMLSAKTKTGFRAGTKLTTSQKPAPLADRPPFRS
ncbi:hypothetical protein NQ315_001214 [Exocentrus adspersus]|uniref:Kinesin-like protein n=1 Tax=Exocentrus adspersus TaxID=1586481 RepID=A0AAV8WER1_9CUCU|nr:hypothetical protein NQ315_001214 [Exocentrus adspersus]